MLVHQRFETNARPQRRLLKEQAQNLVLEDRFAFARLQVLFQPRAEDQDFFDLFPR